MHYLLGDSLEILPGRAGGSEQNVSLGIGSLGIVKGNMLGVAERFTVGAKCKYIICSH